MHDKHFDINVCNVFNVQCTVRNNKYLMQLINSSFVLMLLIDSLIKLLQI